MLAEFTMSDNIAESTHHKFLRRTDRVVVEDNFTPCPTVTYEYVQYMTGVNKRGYEGVCKYFENSRNVVPQKSTHDTFLAHNRSRLLSPEDAQKVSVARMSHGDITYVLGYISDDTLYTNRCVNNIFRDEQWMGLIHLWNVSDTMQIARGVIHDYTNGTTCAYNVGTAINQSAVTNNAPLDGSSAMRVCRLSRAIYDGTAADQRINGPPKSVFGTHGLDIVSRIASGYAVRNAYDRFVRGPADPAGVNKPGVSASATATNKPLKTSDDSDPEPSAAVGKPECHYVVGFLGRVRVIRQ